MKHKGIKGVSGKKARPMAIVMHRMDRIGGKSLPPFGAGVTVPRKGKAAPRKLSVVRITAATAGELHGSILSGFAVEAIKPVAIQLDIPAEELAGRVGMSRSTYHRKAQTGGTLDALGSDALSKYASLVEKAVEAFDGDKDAARQWLKTEQPGLGSRVPLDFARTTVGFREVEKLLTRIDYGVYA